jgi:quercetin dioxygenase-like cupin family protein
VTFTVVRGLGSGTAGFRVEAGREHGLRNLMLVTGRLPDGDQGPVHCHEGDELLRVVSGKLLVRCGEERRVCGPGDLVAVPAGEWHGFRALADTTLEVVAEYDIGTLFPVRRQGVVEVVEVFRTDLPWGRRPGGGRGWTSDDELRAVLDGLAEEV